MYVGRRCTDAAVDVGVGGVHVGTSGSGRYGDGGVAAEAMDGFSASPSPVRSMRLLILDREIFVPVLNYTSANNIRTKNSNLFV